MKQIAITGMSIVCSAGNNVESFFNAMSMPFIPKNFLKYENELNIDINVYKANKECFIPLKNPLFSNPTSQLCTKAAKDCLTNYMSDRNNIQKPDAIVVGTSTGGQYQFEEYIYSVIKNEDNDFSIRKSGLMATVSRAIIEELDLNCRTMTVSTACTSSANAIAIGASLIERNVSNRVLVGGGDALCHVTAADFHILRLTGSELCRPFGKNRPGITLGEGAGFLMLEPLENVLKEGRDYYALLRGYGMSSDAHHMTAPPENGEGALLCMQSALDKAKLNPKDIDFIIAHGTGTQLNDPAEANAINSLFDNVPVASTKGLTGHTLGGAGVTGAIASIYAIKNKRAFENFNSYENDDDCNINLVQKGGMELDKSPVVLSNSFAFGGNNCTLIFGDKQ